MNKIESIYHSTVRYEWEGVSNTLKKSIIEAMDKAYQEGIRVNIEGEKLPIILGFEKARFTSDNNTYFVPYIGDMKFDDKVDIVDLLKKVYDKGNQEGVKRGQEIKINQIKDLLEIEY